MSGIPNPSLSGARHLAWLLALKFAALGLLWLLFFSAQRPAVDAAAAGRQLAVESPGD